MTLERPGGETEDALQTDVYLESLLAARERRSESGRPVPVMDELEPEQRRAARLLAAHLVRFHPSYRFEEALADRLRAAAAGLGAATTPKGGGADRSPAVVDLTATLGPDAAPIMAGRHSVVVPFPLAARETPSDGVEAGDPGVDPSRLALIVRDAAADRRRVLIGSAIASGVSLAGAALVAWRVASPPRSAFGRATRAAHRSRPVTRGRA